MRNSNNRILINWQDAVKEVYGNDGYEKILVVINEIKATSPIKIKNKLTNKDIFTIAYGNSIESRTPNLGNVPKIMKKYYPNINYIHFLPFFKWTSDDGFSVSDYYNIDERNGQWDDLNIYKDKYSYMFDFVVNHSSKENPWFKNFLEQKPGWEDFYVIKDDSFDYSNIVRPRTTPLFHEYGANKIKVWTTFSEDQVDLNYKSVNVLSEVIKLLSFYVSKGMETVRLDAVGFIWKVSGDSGMHHPIAHKIIKIIKSISYELFGELKIISEVNVPHEENMTYLGENGNESDEVYNFALPPLMAYTLLTESTGKFNNWMKFFDELGSSETMFNFLASHDGVGQRPIENILNNEEKEILVNQAKKVGAKFNLKSLPDGSTTVYEINSTYVDMIFENNGDNRDYKKLLLAHSLLLFFRGTPAIYINSLFVKRNDFKGLEKTGRNRSINREHFDIETFDKTISDKDKMFIQKLNDAMGIRITNEDFDPYAKQEVIPSLPNGIIGFKRGFNTKVFANITGSEINIKDLFIPPYTVIVANNEGIISSITY